MEEALFIDQVDTEWCLRARSMGYRVFGACGAILEHRLGEAYYRIWFGRWRQLPRHKPFRYYLRLTQFPASPWTLIQSRRSGSGFSCNGLARFLEVRHL